MAPAHPHSTSVAVYPALLRKGFSGKFFVTFLSAMEYGLLKLSEQQKDEIPTSICHAGTGSLTCASIKFAILRIEILPICHDKSDNCDQLLYSLAHAKLK